MKLASHILQDMLMTDALNALRRAKELRDLLTEYQKDTGASFEALTALQEAVSKAEAYAEKARAALIRTTVPSSQF